MKKILKPLSEEECIFYSDFQGKVLDFVPVNIKIECGYGSTMDGMFTELHLTDEEAKKVLQFIKSNLTEESKRDSNEFWDNKYI